MSECWNDFCTLLFKRALLLGEQAMDVVSRYLRFVKQAMIVLLPLLGALQFCFVICVLLGVQSPWPYQALIVLMAVVLIGIMVIVLPLLLVSQGVFAILPDDIADDLRTWQHRGGAILFAALLAVVIIRVFRLWQSPETMFTVLLVLGVLWLGDHLRIVEISQWWRKFVAVKLQMTLAILLFAAVLPGPAGLIDEVVDWAGRKARSSVHQLTRSRPERWEPATADELRAAFVDKRTGEPLLYYAIDGHGGYELYQATGFDAFGTPLKRAETQQEFDTLLAWQRAQDEQREALRRAQEEEATRRQEAERLANAEQERLREEALAEQSRQREIEEERARREQADREREEFLNRYLADRSPRIDSSLQEIALLEVNTVKKRIDRSLGGKLVSLLHGEGFRTRPNFFSDPFVEDGMFEKLSMGSWAVAEQLELERYVDWILFCALSVSYADHPDLLGMVSARAEALVTLVDASSGQAVVTFSLWRAGPGFSRPDAEQEAYERLAHAILQQSELRTILKQE